MDFWAVRADGCPEAGDFVCHLSVDFSVIVAGSSTSGPPKLRTALSSAVGMWSRGMLLQVFPCILPNSEVLGEVRCRSFLGVFVALVASGRRLGALGDVMHGPIDVVHEPIKRVLLNLPKISFTCSIPFNIVFVGRVVKARGQLSLGGIQFATDVDEAVVVGVLMFVWWGDDWGSTMWSCHTWGVDRTGRLCIRPGIKKSRPGKSGQGGGRVLPANLIKIFLEFGALCLGNDSRSHNHKACLVVVVNKAFTADPPAGAHEGGIAPFEAISQAFSREIALPIFASFS